MTIESSVNITEKQHQVLLGILLGDAHFELANNGKSARLKIEQSKDKSFYVDHLHSIFSSWNPGGIRRASGKKKDNFAFSTKYSTSLFEYHQRFYPDKKHIPRDIENDFTERSFAYLFMDDGGIKSKESKGVYINTYSFPEDEQKSFCNFLSKKFNLDVTMAYDGKSPRIYIGGHNYETLVDLLHPYLLPGFEYKVPSPRSPGSRFNIKK